MNEAITAAFEAVLQTEYRHDPAKCRDGVGWWRFDACRLELQAGIHTDEFRVIAFVGRLDSDPAILGALSRGIEAANARLENKLAVLAEEDCYLQVQCKLPLSKTTPAAMKQAIDRCFAVARAPEAVAVLRTWRQR